MTTDAPHSSSLPEPSEDAIRDYAYHLYLQNGSAPGRDFDNWLEATTCLKAKIALDQPVPHPQRKSAGLEGEALHSFDSGSIQAAPDY